MTRNNILLLVTLGALAVALTAIKIYQSRNGMSAVEPIVHYAPLPHPYCNACGVGAAAYGADSGTRVRVVVGQESTMANLSQNIESLFTVGHQAFAFIPVDPAGAKGLFTRLKKAGRFSVAYGAQPAEGSDTPFAVATDTQAAATLAAEKLCELLGYNGRILNVLESLTDANTPIRQKAIETVVAKYPGVRVIQTVGDVTTEQKAREKIESALVARGDEVDGVICTGYTTTVAAAMLLAERNRKPGAKRVRFVGLDTDERVLAAIREGGVDMTLAQNPFGHGYISCALLDLMLQGWTPKADYAFVDAGCVPVTKENVDTFQAGIEEMTKNIVGELKTKYLDAPGR
ncbi:MAG TPA: sugar ABC transporter substrate-binding protein [Verrucomicrobiota bacterium]|nr:sugar ABC transporter substrate-binding protein [Verrucomicrobiota bacterium]